MGDRSSSLPAVSSERGIRSKITPTKDADELLTLLLRRHNGQGNGDDEDATIERLMRSLIDARIPFDPRTSLNGPLFAALYQFGDAVPFWEKYSKFRPGNGDNGRKNLKGQRYVTVPKELDDGGGEVTYDLTNYAEFFGEAFSVQASATCVRNTDQPAASIPSPPSSASVQNNFFSDLFTKASAIISSSPDAQLLPTPQDYTVDVSGADIRLLGNDFHFDFEGTGFLRVLYAEPRLRIFTVPKDTTNGFVNEKVGLTVAQVRVDLVDPLFLL